jgi:hypothetical protein
MTQDTSALRILFVENVARSAAFYEEALGLVRTVSTEVFVEYALSAGCGLGMTET